MNKEKIKEIMEEEVKQPEMANVPEPEMATPTQQTEQKPMVLRKGTIIELVNQAKATLEPGIIASVIENIETDSTFWDRVNHLPFSSLFSGKVKVVWGQENESEAPEIAFVSRDMVTLLNSIMEDIISLSVFHQTAKMRISHHVGVIHDYMEVISLLTRLNTLVSVAMNVLIERQRAAQQQA